jgi:hypothetical protein
VNLERDLAPDRFHSVIVDEFHHANRETESTVTLLRRVTPRAGGSLLAAVLALTAWAVISCGGGSISSTTVQRPYTDARLEILSPTPNEVTGPNVTIRFAVQGATVSPPNKLKLVPNEGHIHVSVDGKLIVMSYGLSTEVTGLSPGVHVLQGEFVANDHLPFADRVLAAVIFTVKP